VEELSAVYRYLLRSNEQEVIPLEEEIRFIQSYEVLLKTRFGNGFRIEYRIDPEHLDHLLPPLTLQLLVENAVKHNVVSVSEPLVIQIFTTESDRLHVHNNLQRKNRAVPSSKVGLANIQNKYRLLRQTEPEIQESDGQFKVILPLIKSNNYERIHY
jgi:two-component system LytT family sensor kinase